MVQEPRADVRTEGEKANNRLRGLGYGVLVLYAWNDWLPWLAKWLFPNVPTWPPMSDIVAGTFTVLVIALLDNQGKHKARKVKVIASPLPPKGVPDDAGTPVAGHD